MTTYAVTGGRSASYPAKHYGGYYNGGDTMTFCEDPDLMEPDDNVLLVPNQPVTVMKKGEVIVGPEFFGIHFNKRANDRSTAVTIKTVRSFDIDQGRSRWSVIQPTNTRNLASWNFRDLDAWVNTHYAAGRDMLFTLFGTPTWASARPTEEGAYGPFSLGIQAEPADMTDWDFYCTTIATRYKGKIKYYEVWNEPNIGNNGTGLDGTSSTFFYSGTWAKLSEMVRRANVAIKAVDPTAKITTPPVQGWLSTGTDTSGAYFAGMIDAPTGDGSTKMKDWIDIIGVHIYTPNTGAALAGMVDRVMAARLAAGLTATDVWDTESSAQGVRAAVMTDSQLCRYFSRSLITLAAKGIKRHIFYMVDSSVFGFIGRTVVESHWNDLRNLLMNGEIVAVSKLWDGRIIYRTNTGRVTII